MCYVMVLPSIGLATGIMAEGQLTSLNQGAYSVGLESGARSSPDSSGSPQRCDAAAATWHYSFEKQRIPVDFVPEREDYKRIAGSGVYLKSLAPAPNYFSIFSILGFICVLWMPNRFRWSWLRQFTQFQPTEFFLVDACIHFVVTARNLFKIKFNTRTKCCFYLTLFLL